MYVNITLKLLFIFNLSEGRVLMSATEF